MLVSKRAAVRSGKKLNELVEKLDSTVISGLRVSRLVDGYEAKEAADAVRVANEVIYQYFCIPKDVREFWHQEVGSDGVPVQDLAEE